MTRPGPQITVMLQALRGGDRKVLDELVPLVFDELRRLARSQLARERPGHTLDSVALVNEAYLNLVKGEELDVQNRGHFFGVLANVMRRLLVDHARARGAEKRGGGARRLSIDDVELALSEPEAERMLALDDALERLAAVDAEAAKIVELRYFGGVSGDEAARLLDLSRATATRRWAFAKAWLHRELKDGFEG